MTMTNIAMYAKYILSLYQNIFVEIFYIDTDLVTTHGPRSSPIPKIVRRSTPLLILVLFLCVKF